MMYGHKYLGMARVGYNHALTESEMEASYE